MEQEISTFRQLYFVCKETNKKIYEAAIDYEVSQGEYSEYQIRLQAQNSLNAMKNAIKEGLQSTEQTPKAF